MTVRTLRSPLSRGSSLNVDPFRWLSQAPISKPHLPSRPTPKSPSKFQSGPPPADFTAALDEIPSLGSPFGASGGAFGLSPEYKRLAAIIGEANFPAPRRAWAQATAAAGTGRASSVSVHLLEAVDVH